MINDKQPNNNNKKSTGEETNRQIMEQEMQISQKHTEKFSTSLAVGKHIKIKEHYFYQSQCPKKTKTKKNLRN